MVIEDQNQAAVRRGIVRTEGKGAAVGQDRLVGSAAFAEQVGEVGVGVGVRWLEGDGALELAIASSRSSSCWRTTPRLFWAST